MRYALLCYGSEDEIAALDSAEEEALGRRCREAAQALPPGIGPGQSLRLLPTSTAITLRINASGRTLDGPYMQTREQLLGLWLFECSSLDEALLAARRIAEAHGIINGALEIRPVARLNSRLSDSL